jgi:hypothetical protein
LADQPPATFQNTLPSFDKFQEAIKLCNDIWYVTSVEDGANYLAELNGTLDSQSFFRQSSTDATAWVVTKNSSGIIYVVFKAFNYGDPNEWKMVGEADLALLGSDGGSNLVGATTSDMRSRNVRVQSGWNRAIFERSVNSTDSSTLYEKILAAIHALLYNSKNSYTNITCTGSSQGGVMSTIFASYLAATDMADRNIKVITFGAPAVGNKAYQSYANSLQNLAIWKVQHQDDPVPFFGIFMQPGHSIRLSPLKNGTVDFQLYYRQYGNTTMGLAATPDYFMSKVL